MSLTRVWSTDISDTVQVAPTVAAGTVFVGTNLGTLEAFDANSGQEQWTFDLDGGLSRCRPVFDEGFVFAGVAGHSVGEGSLHALDANTGMEGWQYEDGEAKGVAVDDTTVYASAGTRVVALDVVDGSERWAFDKSDVGGYFGAPVVAGGVVAVACEDDQVYALDTATGDGVWTLATSGDVGSGDNQPVTDGETVYVGDWETVYAVDPATGRGRWSASVDGTTSMPVLGDGRLYVGGGDTVTALDASSGDVEWSTSFKYDVSVPAVEERGVYVGTDAGGLYELDPEDGSRRASLDLGRSPLAEPAATETALFVATAPGEGSTDRKLYGVDLFGGDAPGERTALGEEPPPGFQHREIDGQSAASDQQAAEANDGGATGTDEPVCPNCGDPVPSEAQFCPGCGTGLSSDECPSCGAETDPDANFCMNCGHEL